MVKVIIEQVLEFEEDFILEVINNDRNWEDLDGYENFEDIPSEEIEEYFSKNDDFIIQEMFESDYIIKQIIVENDDND